MDLVLRVLPLTLIFYPFAVRTDVEPLAVLLEKSFFLELFRGSDCCREEVESQLKHKVEMNKFKDIALE